MTHLIKIKIRINRQTQTLHKEINWTQNFVSCRDNDEKQQIEFQIILQIFFAAFGMPLL